MAFFDEFDIAIKQLYANAVDEERLIQNPGPERLRRICLEEPEVRETSYGSIVANTEPMSRAKPFTKNNIDATYGQAEFALLAQAKQALNKQQLICMDVLVRDEGQPVTARLLVPRRFAHIAYGGHKLFGPRVNNVTDPTYQVIFFYDDAWEQNGSKPLPEKDITIRLVHSQDGRMIKLVRNSSYLGEWKKGVFAGEDWRAKLERQGIFLHAGCRRDCLEMAHGGMQTQTSLFVALSANGKTSLTCRVMARKNGEESWLIQDDGGILKRDGSFHGFEQGGIYAKTDGLTPSEQIETYYGALKPDAYLENVHVDQNGDMDFFNIELTSNGRVVVERRDFMHAHRHITASDVNNLFIITRGPTVPAVSKLTPEQASAFMVLGQSMESSAGDPTQAGKIKNVFFYDPFLAGDRVDHAHLFHEILAANPHINCYLLNTGGVGEGEHFRKITLGDTVNILESILRGDLEDWEVNEAVGLAVPKAVSGVESILMHPEKLFPKGEFGKRQAALHETRLGILESFGGLDRAIVESIKK
ncbi:phosphoenolpyruvate carboxykinase [Fundidesulfovibrio terrae]|uniref:phosphoenolpyruvate carboxykinase n=1 Tax=Fundidesulfovibrio terrae TaxID=2922866 RepID=UPI001FAF45F9|nr:phosphoenolpyruvate carboxykinase [Fundidesulfovibrio terrae]